MRPKVKKNGDITDPFACRRTNQLALYMQQRGKKWEPNAMCPSFRKVDSTVHTAVRAVGEHLLMCYRGSDVMLTSTLR